MSECELPSVLPPGTYLTPAPRPHGRLKGVNTMEAGPAYKPHGVARYPEQDVAPPLYSEWSGFESISLLVISVHSHVSPHALNQEGMAKLKSGPSGDWCQAVKAGTFPTSKGWRCFQFIQFNYGSVYTLGCYLLSVRLLTSSLFGLLYKGISNGKLGCFFNVSLVIS